MAFGPTHWNVRPEVRQLHQSIALQFGTSWNSYLCHPNAWCLDDVSVDHWGPGGRGMPIGRRRGADVARFIIRRHRHLPVKYILWHNRRWTPAQGWIDFERGLGLHDDHVHTTHDLYSVAAGIFPPWP